MTARDSAWHADALRHTDHDAHTLNVTNTIRMSSDSDESEVASPSGRRLTNTEHASEG